MKQLSRISIFFFLLLAMGCNSQTETPTSFPVTATIENTETPKPTSTTTTSLSPTPEQVTIEFPEWVKNPETQILLVPVGTHDKGYENMALYNAETGERFDIPFTEKVGDYFWMPDGSAFGFLHAKLNQITLYSITNGIINSIPISKESLRFFPRQSIDLANSIEISTSNFTDPKFLLLSSWDSLSIDRRYFIYQEKYDETYTSVFDIYKNEIIYISDPNDNFIDLQSEWSPNSNLLAIVEVDEIPEMFNAFRVLPTFRLRIYDVESQEVVASYKNVTFPIWAPDGTKFLFQEWVRGDSGFYSYWGSPPCIYDTLDGTTNCYYETLTEEFDQFSSLSWSPNQSMIGYISSDKGFCKIILSTTELKCVLEKLDPENPFVDNFSWSPDGNFIAFEYGSTGAYSDDAAYRKLGIANILTGEYFSIGDDLTYSQLGLWRPSPNP